MTVLAGFISAACVLVLYSTLYPVMLLTSATELEEEEDESDRDLDKSTMAQPEPDELDGNAILGTFYYPWYGHWRQWNIKDHSPPETWASNYLPDILPGKFKPSEELYNSMNITIVEKHLTWMKRAGIQLGISSWWGQAHYTDNAFNKIISSDITNRAYPGFKWSILYEKEGFEDPSIEEIISDLNYIKSKYVSSTHYLKIGGKPVIFVYNAQNTGYIPLDDYNRWKKAKSETGFYIVFKVDPIAIGADPSGMDSWYQYAPSKRYDRQGDWSAMVSPGFWKYHEESPRLARNINDFELAVQRLANADVQFKLIKTFNEWSEGTGIEPANLVNHDDEDGFSMNSLSYGTQYLDILAKYFKTKGAPS
jgi:hypothetical protein